MSSAKGKDESVDLEGWKGDKVSVEDSSDEEAPPLRRILRKQKAKSVEKVQTDSPAKPAKSPATPVKKSKKSKEPQDFVDLRENELDNTEEYQAYFDALYRHVQPSGIIKIGSCTQAESTFWEEAEGVL